jgi:hypothetical protein
MDFQSENKNAHYTNAYGILILKEERIWFVEINSPNGKIPTVVNITEVMGLKELAHGKHRWQRLLPASGNSEARHAYKAIQNGEACLAILTFEKSLAGCVIAQVIEVQKSAVIDDFKQEVEIANSSIHNYLSKMKNQSSQETVSISRNNPIPEMAGPLTIDLVKIEIFNSESEIHFRGVLVVDNERICRISSPGNGIINADQWNEGCSDKDMEALDIYIAATGEPRDNGTTPDSLAATIIDRISMHASIQAYRQATMDTTLFFLEEQNGGKILSIKIPDGGTREGAREVMKKTWPNAASLDLMTEEEATITWITFSE